MSDENKAVCEKGRSARDRAWVRMLAAVEPAFGGRAFAIGDACAAAIHYGECYEDMEDFSFALLREDFDERRAAIAAAARAAGFQVKDEVRAGAATYERPYLSIGTPIEGGEEGARETGGSAAAVAGAAEAAGAPAPVSGAASAPDGASEGAPVGWAWLDVYPLDTIPTQVTLRFKIFKQASKAMAKFRDMEARGDFSGMPAFQKSFDDARRYDGVPTGLRSNLCGRGKSKRMGERTVFQRTIDESELFPVRSLPFAGGTIPVSRKVSNWTMEMTPQRRHVIDVIQEESLESLEAIDGACEQLGVTYFLVGGSMLGAVRDGGFIPWDDDTDVGMLRKDYQAFCKQVDGVLGEDGYFLQLPRTDKHIHFVYARLRKNGVQYITYYNQDKDFNRGIWVDIFPFDARPKNEALAKAQRVLANTFARASMALKRRREYVEADCKTSMEGVPDKDRRYLKRFRFASHFFPVTLCRWGYNFCARFFNPFLGRSKDALYASFVPSYTTIARDEVQPVRRVPFEDGELCIPYGAEAFLTRQYGDYESLPPEHERYAEHGFKCLIDESGKVIEG